MGLNVSNNLYSGIDATALKEVAAQIFNRANAKNPILENADLTKFNRANLGTELYSNKTDATVAKQIAMNNAGLQVSLSDNAVSSLRYLNSKAAIANFAVKESIAQANEAHIATFNKLAAEAANLDSDKKGSNPFYNNSFAKTEKETKEEVLNIFA